HHAAEVPAGLQQDDRLALPGNGDGGDDARGGGAVDDHIRLARLGRGGARPVRRPPRPRGQDGPPTRKRPAPPPPTPITPPPPPPPATPPAEAAAAPPGRRSSRTSRAPRRRAASRRNRCRRPGPASCTGSAAPPAG